MGCPDVVTIGGNCPFEVTTNDPTGAIVDANAVPTYRVYATEGAGAALLTGSMAKRDDANTTGFYLATVAITAANGFEVAHNYTIYIEASIGTPPVVGAMTYSFRVDSAAETRTASGTGWTYDSTIPTTKDEVRFVIGDIDAGNPLVADAEIAYALSKEGDNILLAGARVCDHLAAMFSARYDFATGKAGSGFTASSSQLAKAYRALAVDLRSRSSQGMVSSSNERIDGYTRKGQYDNEEILPSSQNPRRWFYGEPDILP